MPLTTFAKAVVAQGPDRIEAAVKTASAAGAAPGSLLLAVDVARAVTDVAPQVVTNAYASVHQWA